MLKAGLCWTKRIAFLESQVGLVKSKIFKSIFDLIRRRGWYAKSRVICRVTLKDGTFHEDMSVAGRYAKTEAEAEMMACKTAVTDARKRVLRCFGRALGNSVYDKASLVQKQKKRGPVGPVAPPQFNRDASHQNKKPRVSIINKPFVSNPNPQGTQKKTNNNSMNQKKPNNNSMNQKKSNEASSSIDYFGDDADEEFFQILVEYEVTNNK